MIEQIELLLAAQRTLIEREHALAQCGTHRDRQRLHDARRDFERARADCEAALAAATGRGGAFDPAASGARCDKRLSVARTGERRP